MACVSRLVTVLVLCAATASCRTPSHAERSSGMDLPPFYDAGNIAEYYGRCPRCNSWVKGYVTFWDGVDSQGNLGGGSGILGRCSTCQRNVLAEEPSFRNEWRIVVWHVEP